MFLCQAAQNLFFHFVCQLLPTLSLLDHKIFVKSATSTLVIVSLKAVRDFVILRCCYRVCTWDKYRLNFHNYFQASVCKLQNLWLKVTTLRRLARTNRVFVKFQKDQVSNISLLTQSILVALSCTIINLHPNTTDHGNEQWSTFQCDKVSSWTF